ncbi:DUF1839 family protein [Rhizobium sp. L1K21]|uniref:DUF1839 family protein n=1 Tax=Rhizobium sp. L1K21 TaxID=2954933 RepID=UPI002092E08E|nr:DUF1839 family protein [Rhizobium sp. L1K21]MCO6185298.1 DUF1839 family protein [Rhizobium sp. L1K21]
MTQLLNIKPQGWQIHALHDPERMWPQTNCYTDVWVEVLSALNLPPEATLGFTLTQDFEGDHFTFFKVPLEDLETLFGIVVSELAIYDRVENHVENQLKRGRYSLVEVDSYYLPDTHGVGYHSEHGKSTVAINRIDIAGRSMDYFHNEGFFHLEGDDFDGLFHRNAPADALPFLPYCEFVKLPETYPDEAAIRAEAIRLCGHHFKRAPKVNPIRTFAGVFVDQAESVGQREFGFFHKYAFNTLRQAGANFELAASYLKWLGGDFEAAGDDALKISEVMKTSQFHLARAVARSNFAKLDGVIDPAADAWDSLMAKIAKTVG